MSTEGPKPYPVVYNSDDGFQYSYQSGYVTIPTVSGSFLPLSGGTLTGALTINPATNQLVLGGVSGGHTLTLTSPANAADRVYTIPDAGGDSTFILAAGTPTFTAAPTFQKNPVYAATSIAGTGTVTADARTGPTLYTTVTGAVTLNGPSNGVDGQKLTFRILNDGSHSVTLATGSGNFRFGTDITSYTNSVSLTDYIGAIYSSAASRWDVVSIIQGF